jgi:hypothetical protein
MENWRMTILYDQHLPGESLAHILEKELNMVVSLYALTDLEVITKLEADNPDLLLIVEEESPCHEAVLLAGKVLEKYPTLPLIRIKLSQHVLHVYTAHTIPARSPDLIDAIKRTLKGYRGKAEQPDTELRS